MGVLSHKGRYDSKGELNLFYNFICQPLVSILDLQLNTQTNQLHFTHLLLLLYTHYG